MIVGNFAYRQPSFSFENRIMRQVWSFCWVLFFRFSPRPFHAWRVLLLRIFGAKLGSGCHIYPGVKIWAPWNLHLGDCVGIGDGVNLYCMDRITIGNYAVISQGAYLSGGTHDYNSSNFQLLIKPIEIGAHAWVCAEAFLHAGVVVPEGAVIGARAVVTRSLDQAWGVYAGNPCRLVNTRKIGVQ